MADALELAPTAQQIAVDDTQEEGQIFLDTGDPAGVTQSTQGKQHVASQSRSELVVDEEDDLDGPCFEYKCHPAEITVRGCNCKVLQFNPVVFGVSIFVIWGFVIWAASEPAVAGPVIAEWQTWIVANFTWLYNGCLVMFIIFCTYIICSKYGDIKLGQPDDEPDFSLASWFTMLFSAGIGIGMFFFGVGEPVQHFADAASGSNRFASLPLNEQATAALNLTWFHWGFAASTVYCIVGLPLAFFAHRKKLPMTIRTCFYSLYGDDVNGPVGDIVDALAVIGTMFGVGTSLGLGVLQLSTGLHRVNPNIPDSLDGQILIICVITLMATISVVSGLDVGIRRLSEGNFIFGLILVFFLFFMGGTVFQLDLLVQTAGYHVQYVIQLMFHTDAWERDGFNGGTYPTHYSTAKNQTDPNAWMSWWSVFYWAWWIAWSPFVGVFIATISKGRTIREFILGNVFVPTIFTSVWLTVFGGLGIRQEMNAMLNGYTCAPSTMKPPAPWDTLGPNGETNIPIRFVRLSCRSYTNRLFDLLETFPVYDFISIITIISMTAYFVTSSDSASHVIDVITCNGRKEPPMLQRIFWAFMEGAVAIALLSAGGSEALSTLQTASIAAGLPVAFVLIIMMFATKRALDVELGWAPDTVGLLDLPKKAPEAVEKKEDELEVDDEPEEIITWSTRTCYMPTQWFSCETQICEMDEPLLMLGSVFLPCLVQIQTQLETGQYEEEAFADSQEEPCCGNEDCCITESCCAKSMLMGFIGFSVLLTIILAAIGTVNTAFFAFAGEIALVYWSASVYYRVGLRKTYGIHGSIMGDCGSYLCCYMCAVYQEAIHVRRGGAKYNGVEGKDVAAI